MTKSELGRYSGPNHDGAASTSPYPVSLSSPAISLVDTAREIEAASASVAHQANAQLRVVAEQIRYLQEQAARIIDKARTDVALHHAQCSLVKIPGRVYHLYDHPLRGRSLSMLSPADYRGNPPHPYVGSYRLEADQSWTELGGASEPRADAAVDTLGVPFLELPGRR